MTNKTNNVLAPFNRTVVVKFYDNNPYEELKKSEAGIILSSNDGHKLYKSNETGEMERNEEKVSCAEIIAVGPDCRCAQVGDHVFLYRHRPIPLPYYGLEYYAVDEQNIMTAIRSERILTDHVKDEPADPRYSAAYKEKIKKDKYYGN